MKADAKTEAEIKAAITKFADRYEKRDMDGLMACIAPDADVVLYGTGADEKRIGPAEIRFQAQRDWDQSDALSMAFDWMSISAAGPVGWVACDGAFKIRAGGQAFTVPARGTFVLEKREGKWLVVQSHFSVAATSQEEGDSIPA